MKLQVPEGYNSVGFEGEVYEAVDGVVEVPNHAAILLEPGYGCTLITEPLPKKGKKDEAKE